EEYRMGDWKETSAVQRPLCSEIGSLPEPGELTDWLDRGIISPPVPKRLPLLASIDDWDFIDILATLTRPHLKTIFKTHSYLPILSLYPFSNPWKESIFIKSPYWEITAHLVETCTGV
ncbi:hypothetical protein STEG23_031139, partial [Scotinomys teguina]